MSTLTPTRKVSRKHELREDKVITFSARVLGLIETNRTVVYGGFALIVIVLAGIFGFSYVQSSRNTEALEQMTEAVSRYESGDYATAIDGDMLFPGLVEVAEKFGNTKAGNLARFYAADALFRTGDLERSLTFFQAFNKDGDFLGASAYAGEAAINETNGNFDKAGDLYLRAATIYESDVTSPGYLLRAARSYEAAGDVPSARQVYEQLGKDYPVSREGQNVEFYLARIGE
ncbi:MAG: tetratricopeptide repeat protein [Rhodothermia bacterium]|nr:MAG: tetratricopeptide repeat protein [Rhodothermia bacterium]